VDESVWLAERFEENRTRLRAVAYRMLGSASDAEDAVQEAWLRLSRADTGDVQNLAAWLTTVVARVCLNMLRAREHRREEPFDPQDTDTRTVGTVPGATVPGGPEGGPEQEAVLADSVGIALLVVLDTLTPAERIAFVLHDMFAVPFDRIGPMIERSPVAARQLASRARRRVKGAAPVPGTDQVRRRRVVDAYLAAARGGDFEALVELLDPDVVLHADRFVTAAEEPVVVRGAALVAKGAHAAAPRARFTQAALIDGAVGLVMMARGRLAAALVFTLARDGRISGIDVFAEPGRLRALEISVLDG
jgi:RNA polymerase sigma-70 factor (ECF subfamily)